MKPYVKLYLKHFGYDVTDFIPCEVCSAKSVDIHHIKARGMGGSKTKDKIENLQALCRQCHLDFGDKKQHLDFLIEKHAKKLGYSIAEKLCIFVHEQANSIRTDC